MKRRSIQFFQCQTQSPCKIAARGDGVSIAGGDQRQRVALRLPGDWRQVLQCASQIVLERWSGTHGEDTGFGPRMVSHRGDITGGKHARMRDRLQRIVHQDEAAVVGGKSDRTRPQRWRSTRFRIARTDALWPGRSSGPSPMSSNSVCRAGAIEGKKGNFLPRQLQLQVFP